MKNLLNYLFLIVGVFTYPLVGHSQDILAEGNVWNMSSQGFSPTIHYYSFRIHGDSIVDSQSYKILQRTSDVTDDTSWYDYRLLREEDESKVYLLGNEEETLLFDFSMEVGDTMVTDDFSGCTIEVYGIDTITLNNGEERRRFDMRDSNNPLWAQEIWIEGIGSDFGIIPVHEIILCGTDYGEFLRCFSGSDGVVQYPIDNGVCYETTTVEEITLEDLVSISPNPFRDNLFIELNQASVMLKSVYVYSTTGMKVLESKIEGSTVNLDTALLAKGVYYILLEDDKGNKYSRKLVKR